MSGANAALQLLPVAAFMVDALGVLQGCNELFEGIAGVPHEILLGREWWQAFAARSAEDALSAHSEIVESVESRGTRELSLLRSDGAPCRLSLRWLRVTEPATRRPLWIFAAYEVPQRVESSTSSQPHALSLAEHLAVAASEIDALRALAAGGRAGLEEVLGAMERISGSLRARVSSGPPSLPVVDVIKRALSAALLDPARPVRLKVESSGTVRAQPTDPARVLSFVVEHARARCSAPPVQVRVFDRPTGVCFEVVDGGRPLDAEAQARALSPRSAAGGSGDAAPSDLELASLLVASLGGTFELESSVRGGLTVRFTLAPRA
jgi:signal transduction histidine kinase